MGHMTWTSPSIPRCTPGPDGYTRNSPSRHPIPNLTLYLWQIHFPTPRAIFPGHGPPPMQIDVPSTPMTGHPWWIEVWPPLKQETSRPLQISGPFPLLQPLDQQEPSQPALFFPHPSISPNEQITMGDEDCKVHEGVGCYNQAAYSSLWCSEVWVITVHLFKC